MSALYHIAVHGEAEKAAISHSRPEGVTAPNTWASVRYLPEQGLEIKLHCDEQNPYAIRTEPNGAVCMDSCMEAFIDCFPALNKGYFNLEVNALGTVHCAFGPDRHQRTYLTDMNLPHPTVQLTKEENYWEYVCLMPLSTLEALYGCACQFAPGHEMHGNFYKCIEDGPAPHWAAWAEVSKLDFHCPHEFGVLKIEE